MKRVLFLLLILPALMPFSAWASPASEEADTASSLARSGCYDSAVKFYDKALQLNPGYEPAIAGRAAALKLLKKVGKTKTLEVDEATAKKYQPQKKGATAKTAEPVKDSEDNSVQAAKGEPPKKAAKSAQAKKTAAKPVAAMKAQVNPPVETKRAQLVKKTIDKTASSPIKPPVSTAASIPLVKAVTTASAKPVAPTQPVLTTSKESHPALSHHALLPVDVGSAPPASVSGLMPTDNDADSQAPAWLIQLAVATFLVLIGLGIWWLSPTLSASRQLHHRLKGLERHR